MKEYVISRMIKKILIKIIIIYGKKYTKCHFNKFITIRKNLLKNMIYKEYILKMNV